MGVPQILGGLGGLASAYGSILEGNEAERLAKLQAAHLRENAGQTEAAGQQASEEEIRKSELTLSRMIAVAAASGGGAADPTVLKLASGAAAEGELAAGMQRYNAASAARGMRIQAGLTEQEGAAKKRASRWRAAGGLLTGGYHAFGK